MRYSETRSAAGRAARAHGERMESLRGKCVGCNEQGRAPRALLHDERKQPRTPLRRTGEAPGGNASTIARIRRERIRPDFKKRWLPASPGRSGKRTRGKERQHGGQGAPRAEPRCKRRVDGGRGHAKPRRNEQLQREGRTQGKTRRSGAPREKSGSATGRRVQLRRRGRCLVVLDQAWRLKTSVPFVPPNPNEFFSATSIFISRAVFAQ